MKYLIAFLILLSSVPAFAEIRRDISWRDDGTIEQIQFQIDHSTYGLIVLNITPVDCSLELNAQGNLSFPQTLKAVLRSKYRAEIARIQAAIQASEAARAAREAKSQKVVVPISDSDL